MENIKLTDELLIPIMEKHNVTREEAEKRLHLLYEIGILAHGHWENPITQRLIDGFLAQDSKVLAEMVAYEKIFTECLNNKDLVRQYDRLTFSNLGKSIEKSNKGNPPSNFTEQLESFEKFCQETIFSRIK